MTIENGPESVGEAFVPEPPVDTATQEPASQQLNEAAQQVETEGQQEQQNSGNPAWAEFLDKLPTSLHSQVTPVLHKWDQGVQQRFQAIHDEYAPYKQYKEQNVDPETINYALGLVNALNEDPRRVWESMGEYYQLTPQEQQQVQQQIQQESPNGEPNVWDADTEEYVDPRVSQLEQGVKQLAQVIYTQQQEAANKAESDKLATELDSLRSKHGDYDENFVLGQMLNGVSAEDAVKNYQTLTEKIRSEANQPPAPKVMGGGGGALPNESVNPAKMSEAQRRQLAAQMLRNAAERG